MDSDPDPDPLNAPTVRCEMLREVHEHHGEGRDAFRGVLFRGESSMIAGVGTWCVGVG